MLVRRFLIALASLALCGFLPAAAVAATAKPGEVTRFSVPGCLSGDYLAPAPGAGVLLRLCKKKGDSEGGTLGNLLPSGKLVRHGVQRSSSGPIAVQGADVWLDADGSITHLPAAREAHTFPILLPTESAPFGTPIPFVADLVAGGDGKVWALIAESVGTGYGTSSVGGELVGIAADGTMERFRVPEGIEPNRLAFGPDGNLWFTGVKGRIADEHSPDPGTSYIGRMTPTGEFTLFPVPSPTPLGGPGAIAAGPDGRLWFTGPAYDQVGTIGVDGTYGPTYTLHSRGFLNGGMTFGPEGEAWLSFEEAGSGVVRLTPDGQQTIYPGWTDAVTAGREGDIWALSWTNASRIIPGGPGIDLWNLEGERATRKVHLELACGGSKSACRGRLELSLGTPSKRGTVPKQLAAKLPFHLAEVPYSVPAESRQTVTVRVPAGAFPLAARFRHRWPPLRVQVRATVEGGPTMNRWASSATLAGR
jgi:streptogramin lyase